MYFNFIYIIFDIDNNNPYIFNQKKEKIITNGNNSK